MGGGSTVASGGYRQFQTLLIGANVEAETIVPVQEVPLVKMQCSQPRLQEHST